MKKIFCGLILMLVLFAGLSAVHAQSVEQWFDKNGWILGEEYDHYPSDNEIMKMTDSLSDVMAQNPNHPVLWYTKGTLVKLRQGNYHRALLKQGKKYRLDAPENQALIKEYQSYYRKALDLDDNPDAPAHLDARTLVDMTEDVLISADIAKHALRKALDISIAGGKPPYGGEKRDYEWYMYEFLLGAYAQAGDNQAYLDTVNEMMKRYPDYRTEELLKYKRDAEAVIEKRDREAALQEDDSGDEQASAPVAKPAQPLAKMKQAKTKQPNNGHERIWLFALLAVLLIGVGGFFIRRRSKAGKPNDD